MPQKQMPMDTIYNNRGRISPIRTIRLMETGEVWETNTDEVNFLSLRVTCSRYGASTGKFFSVNVADDLIRVERIK